MGVRVKDLAVAALVSFALVLPFAFLEFRFNTVNSRNLIDYVALFGLLWLLLTAFITLFASIVRTLRARDRVNFNPLGLLFRFAVLVALAFAWGSLVADQRPCFLGVPKLRLRDAPV